MLEASARASGVRRTGPAIGRGNRWRHQIAVAPFGPNGERELVDVLTPHIGGVVEFYRMVGDRIEIVATVPGFTSHVIGSRNLDLALAADADGTLMFFRSLNDLFDGSEYCRVHGSAIVLTLSQIPIRRKHVLRQIVGAESYEVR